MKKISLVSGIELFLCRKKNNDYEKNNFNRYLCYSFFAGHFCPEFRDAIFTRRTCPDANGMDERKPAVKRFATGKG
jgi:hypothetical protein